MSDDPTTWDLSPGVIDGHQNAVLAMVESIRRYGALSVEFGYDPNPDGSEPTAEDTVTWWAEATYKHPLLGFRNVRRTAVTTGDHRRGALEALAGLVRERGGKVTTVDQ